MNLKVIMNTREMRLLTEPNSTKCAILLDSLSKNLIKCKDEGTIEFYDPAQPWLVTKKILGVRQVKITKKTIYREENGVFVEYEDHLLKRLKKALGLDDEAHLEEFYQTLGIATDGHWWMGTLIVFTG